MNSDYSWCSQSTWYINTSTGSDENNGLTSGTALKSWTEFRNRISTNLIQQNTSITISGTIPRMVCDMGCVPGATVTVTGTRTVLLASQVINGYTAANKAAIPATANQLTCNTIASWTIYTPDTDGGILIVPTSGPAVGYYAYVAADLTGHVAQCTNFWDPVNQAAATPVVGNNFNIEKCPKVSAYNIAPTSGKWTFQSLYFNQVGADRVSFSTWTASSINCLIATGYVQFQNCSFDLLDITQGSSLFEGCCDISLGTDVEGATIQWEAGMLYGAQFFGSPSSASTHFSGASDVILTNGTILKNMGLVVINGSFVRVYDAGIFNAPNTAVSVASQSKLRIETLWGGTQTGTAVQVSSGSQVVYINKPSINSGLGGTREAIVGGTSKAWSTIPLINTINNAMIVQDA